MRTITSREVIGTLVLNGFRMRDLDLKLFDFYHMSVDGDSGEYNWGIIFDEESGECQVSDSSGYIPFDKVIINDFVLQECIDTYMNCVK